MDILWIFFFIMYVNICDILIEAIFLFMDLSGGKNK